MANTAENLIQVVQGLWADRSNDPSQLPAALGFSPFNKALGNFQYQILDTDLRLDTSDPTQGGAVADHADYAQGVISYSTVTKATQRRAAQGFVIPNAVMEAIEDQNGLVSLADDAMRAVSNQLLDQFTLDFITQADAGFTDAPTLDLSTQSLDLQDYFDAGVQAVETGSGKRCNAILMGKKAAMRLAGMDTIQNGPGVAIGSDATATRRLGYSSLDRVRAFFKDCYGIELLIEDRTYLNAGTGEYTLDTDMFIGHVDPRGGCMATFSRVADIIDFNVRETAFPSVEGLAVTGDAHWKCEVTDAAAGIRIPVSF